MTPGRIRVLVVDDSAFARKVLREVLSSDAAIEVVGVARDGLDALEKIATLDPDVVTLDLVMPNLDGLGVLAALTARERPRCVVVSNSLDQSALAIEALQAGAIDFVHKPTALATDRLYELSTELVTKVKTAAGVRRAPRALPSPPSRPSFFAALPSNGRVRLVVLGTSTGGPQALSRLLAELPRDMPVPIAAVVHMPPGYTAAFAARLNAACALDVSEAHEGQILSPGQAVIGRAGMHLKVDPDGEGTRVHLDVSPLDTLHRPSVDVLFLSAAEAHRERVLGAVLTGMGDDGVRGARAIRAAGGAVLTEAESSCVVFGMPRAVIEAGLSTATVPLEEMAASILRAL